MRLPIHSYRIENATTGRLVNCYAEALPQDAKAPVRLRRAPGIKSWASVGTGPGRGLHVMSGVLYAVSGSKLYQIGASGTAVELGTISGSKRCWFTDNGTQLVIGTDGGTWYVWDGTLTEITDSDFTSRGARGCIFVDGFAAFIEPGSGRWFVSDLYNSASYDALMFATAEGNPDRLVSIAKDHREAVLLGERTIEINYNAGAAGFPFERSPNGFIDLGCAANQGVCNLDNAVVFLANDLTLRRLTGQTPVRISHHGFEKAIRAYRRVDDCQAFSFTFEGHLQAVFQFPSANATWVYDATTQELHERQTGTGAWAVVDTDECYGEVLAQHSETGAVGTFDTATYTEFGAMQRAEWTYQPVYAQGRRVFHGELEVLCANGAGLITGQGSDPQMTLDVSNDGGRTWITLPTKTVGAQGRYLTRVKWNRLGSSRDRVYRASVSDPIALTVWDTTLT